MEYGTPALLFGAISLMMLAYTNQFFVLAKLIRNIHGDLHPDHRQLIPQANSFPPITPAPD
jgi:hypothetical protein